MPSAGSLPAQSYGCLRLVFNAEKNVSSFATATVLPPMSVNSPCRSCGTLRGGDLRDRVVVDRVFECLGTADAVVEGGPISTRRVDPTAREVLVEVLALDVPSGTGAGCARTLDHVAQRRADVETAGTERL